MVNDHEQTARNAEQTPTNDPGMCLQWSRQRAAIGSRYGDAATAWKNTNDRHPGDRNPPRGSMVFWTGGASGYGHVAPSVGGGNCRSTDSGGKGKVATVDIGWPERNWGLTYAGWAWDVNEVTIPHPTGGGTMDTVNINLKQKINRWSPWSDDVEGDQFQLSKCWSLTEGYAEKAYTIGQTLNDKINAMQADINKIKAALGVK